MSVAVRWAEGFAALGPEWDAVFAEGPGVPASRAFLQSTAEAALPEGVRARLLLAEVAGAPAGLLALADGAGLGSLTSPYTVLFQPLLAPGADARAVGRAWGRALRRRGMVRLEALDPSWDGLAPLLAGFAGAGLVPLRYEMFGNWWANLAGQDWDAYLAARPGALLSTVKRRTKALLREPGVHIEEVRGPEGVERALAAYEAIYARSWKEPEPFPRFNATLLPRLAEAGVLRFGVLWRGKEALAAQYWTRSGGSATVLKLAHDEAHRAASPGTVLTAHMIRSAFAEGGLEAIDFGRGDDLYKRDWAPLRRVRVGVLLAAPWRLAGAAAALRHAAGVMRRRFTARP